MHRFLIASSLACAALGSPAGFAGQYDSAFPYEVQTTTADAPLRCGPGDDFYVTERLGRGHSLTVYRQASGGWLAVRPTESSHSFLATRYARATTDSDVVEVVDDHAVSWVGSGDATPNELKWQVRLKPGEKVVVLGRETRRTYAGGPRELHYRIPPPSGEFRWVHEKNVRHASQVEGDEPAPRDSIQLTDFRVVVQEPDVEPRRDGFVARRPRTDVTSADATSADATSTNATSADAIVGRRDIDDGSRQARRAEGEPVIPQSKLPALDSATFEKRLRDLDVRLSLMVVKPVEDWTLDGLGEEVDRLIAQGGTTVDRGRAQLLAEKMGEFERLQSRYKTTGIDLKRAGLGMTPDSAEPALPPAATGIDPRFDGAGWLFPVHSRNQASPPYALLDADGTILQFISPAPGLNLHRYLQKEIGVFGQQAVIASLDKPHVTAQRVVSLKRHRR